MTQIQEELGKQRHSGNGKGRSVSSSWGRDGLLVFPHDFYGNVFSVVYTLCKRK